MDFISIVALDDDDYGERRCVNSWCRVGGWEICEGPLCFDDRLSEFHWCGSVVN